MGAVRFSLGRTTTQDEVDAVAESVIRQLRVRIAVSVIDCLKGLWEDIAAWLGLLDGLRRNITYHANGCVVIVEAVAERQVDAAFGWTAFEHLAPGRIDVVEMPPEQQVLRGTGDGILRFCEDLPLARRFANYLTTSEARSCYRKYGWVVPGEGEE